MLVMAFVIIPQLSKNRSQNISAIDKQILSCAKQKGFLEVQIACNTPNLLNYTSYDNYSCVVYFRNQTIKKEDLLIK